MRVIVSICQRIDPAAARSLARLLFDARPSEAATPDTESDEASDEEFGERRVG